MRPARDRWERLALLAWLAAIFAVSAVADLRVLGMLSVVALLLFWRGASRALRRVARSVLPATVALVAASWGWLWFVEGRQPAPEPFLALATRTTLIAFVTFAVLARVNLLRALAPWPTPTRLLAMTLSQFHALRMLATDSRQGFDSRMPRRPGPVDLIREAGGASAALLTVAMRNARDAADALRSRGP